MNFLRSIFSFLLVLTIQYGLAQGSVTIKASVDKNKILIGEPLVLTIETDIPENAIIKFIAIDSIEHFELLEKPTIDTISTKSGTFIKGIYKITSFDSGHWVIPAFLLSPAVKTDTIPIDVVFSDFDPNQAYHDIKDILEVTLVEKKVPWWWYAAGGVLLLVIILYFLIKKKKGPPVIVPEAAINPYEEAMKELQKLQKEKTDSKQYHSRLIDIFRLYLFRKKGVLSLQKTTDDLVVQLKTLMVDKSQFDKLSQSLRLSDFVKFAKYIPTDEDDKGAFEEIKNAIMTIEKMESKAFL